MWGDGGMERDLLHVRDAAAAFAAAVARPGPLCGGHWVIGTGEGGGCATRSAPSPTRSRRATGALRCPSSPSLPPAASETDMSGVVVDASAFTAVTGWRAEVPFHDGLDRLVGALARERRLG